MTKETKPHATGTCTFCRKPVARKYPESPWRTTDPRGWNCPDSPAAARAADTDAVTPHEVVR